VVRAFILPAAGLGWTIPLTAPPRSSSRINHSFTSVFRINGLTGFQEENVWPDTETHVGKTGDHRLAATWRGAVEEDLQLSAGVTSLPLGARLSVIRDARNFFSLETQWRELEASAQSARSVFQTFDWLGNWIRVYGTEDSPMTLSVALGYRADRLVFAWPLMRTRDKFVTILRWLSEPVSQYGDALVARGENAELWLSEALAHFAETRGIDAIRLRHVRDDATVAPFLKARFHSARMTDHAPWLDLTAFADEAAYDARYSSAQKKRRKKIRKALEDDLGPVSFSSLEPGGGRNEAIAAAIAEKSRWIEDRGRQNRVLGCERVTGFFQDLAQARVPGVELVLTQLSAGRRAISWEIGLRHQGTHYAFITSHLSELTDYSPARLHMDHSQRLALRDGMKAFDLMVPNDEYKASWCSARTATDDWYLPLTARGRVYGSLYLERLRPFLRDRYYRMPPQLLKLLKPVIGH
jgi:CelD/BcsL family acetyltransferase involved in cellulose biosynthesis